MATRILCFSGSIREESFNRKLASLASQRVNHLGGTATLLDLAEFTLPIYNGDDESSNGLPDGVGELQALMLQHDGLLIASPEYNGFFSPLLKNTIDWLSRSNPELPDQASPFAGKVAGLCAASPGRLGGLRGLNPLRTLLSGIGVTVVSSQLAIPSAYEKFTSDGQLDDATTLQLDGLANAVLACHIGSNIG